MKNIKSKAVPLHAMVVLGGERRYSSYSFLTSALDGGEWSAPRPGRALPHGKDPGTHYTGGWVGLKAGLDTEARGKILCPCRGSNPDRPVVQSVARHYTDWANPVPEGITYFSNFSRRQNVLLIWDFKFSRRRVWCSELSSGMYCRVKWLSTINTCCL
jgi:hypothetical protein